MGWRVEYAGEETINFQRTRDLQLWDTYVGRLDLNGLVSDTPVVLIPPKPIKLPDYFDSINFWIFYDESHTIKQSRTQPIEVGVLITDASDALHTITLSEIQQRGWVYIHHKLDAHKLSTLQHPCHLKGIEFLNVSSNQPAQIYMDSLSFYAEMLPALNLKKRPPPPLPSILPSLAQENYENRLETESTKI